MRAKLNFMSSINRPRLGLFPSGECLERAFGMLIPVINNPCRLLDHLAVIIVGFPSALAYACHWLAPLLRLSARLVVVGPSTFVAAKTGTAAFFFFSSSRASTEKWGAAVLT